MTYTVLGASGFIGSHLVKWLESQGIACWEPGRGEKLSGRHLGHVFYCIGLTADWRQRPFDTIRAHVSVLADLLENAEFASLLYLSTTRVYAGLEDAREDAVLKVDPGVPDQLYNLSKLMGESACLGCGRQNVRVVRLSNVYGDDFLSDNFLFSVMRDAVDRQSIVLRTALDSEKDYVAVQDVVSLLPRIGTSGRHRVYNLASGVNTTNGQIMERLQWETGCSVTVVEGAPAIRFPPISIGRVREEFGFVPRATVLDSIPGLIAEYRGRASVALGNSR